MPKQNNSKGGGRKRREAAFERNATMHHQFIGEAEPERAEAEFHKIERVQEAQQKEAVKEMAAELKAMADKAEEPLRMPRSIDEAKELAPSLLEMFREKARERLDALPAAVRGALHLAENAAGVLFVPVRAGLKLASEVLRVPSAMLRMLTRQEA